MSNTDNYTMLKKKLCACDYVVDLTAQLDDGKLNKLFINAVKNIVNDAKVTWELNDLKETNDISLSAINILEENNSTRVEIWLAHHAIVKGHIAKLLDQNETKELHTLANIYVNQKRHINLSSIDQLTGVLNRQAFNEKIKAHCRPNEFENRRKRKAEKCLALLDIDHFKRVNDNFGHLIGDEVLVVVGQKLNGAFRDDDLCFRYGGEEFAVILTDVTMEHALSVFERFRIAIKSHVFPQVGQITMSIGVAKYSKYAQPSELIGNADKALYYAKEHGRDKVCDYQSLVESGHIAPDSAGSDIEFL